MRCFVVFACSAAIDISSHSGEVFLKVYVGTTYNPLVLEFRQKCRNAATQDLWTQTVLITALSPLSLRRKL